MRLHVLRRESCEVDHKRVHRLYCLEGLQFVMLKAGLRLTGERAEATLSRVARHRPLPRSIAVDHGTEPT